MNSKVQKGPRGSLAVAIAMTLASMAISPLASAQQSTDAIIGTGKSVGTDAIIGTGKGAKTDAIIGTGKGAKTDAIIGTGKSVSTDAIIGTGKGAKTDAIIGTGKGASANAIIGTGRTKAVHVGPIDAVDVSAGTVESLGKTLTIGASAARIADLQNTGRQVSLVVYGKLNAAGHIADASLKLGPDDYVAGATKILVTGQVESVDTGVATLKVGKLVVNYGAAALDRIPVAGDVIALVGTQPAKGSIVLAEEVAVR